MGGLRTGRAQVVWNRNFNKPEFTVTDQNGYLEIDTEYFHLVYDKQEFGPESSVY